MDNGNGAVHPPIPTPDAYLDATFGDGGYLAQTKAGYRPRAGQRALAEAVDRAIRGRTHLLAEAGCGTGKGYGYSIPASYHAAMSGNTVVIVTANIALQEQLIEKDLPAIRAAVPWEFTYELMKGRHHYACQDVWWDRYAKLNASLFHDSGARTPIEEKQLPVLDAWMQACVEAGPELESGDVSDLPFEPDPGVWRQYSVTSDACKKNRCKYKDICFANHAHAHARQSNVLVTNMHMLCAHLEVYRATGWDLVLSPFDICIIDEAHEMSHVAQDFFGFRFTQESVRRLGRKAKKLGNPLVEGSLDHAAKAFFAAMHGLKRDTKRYKARILNNLYPHEVKAWEHLKGTITETIEFYQQSLTYNTHDDELPLAIERCLKTLRGLTMAMEDPNGHHREEGQSRLVHFLDEDEKNFSVSSKLVHASDVLATSLFRKRVCPPPPPREPGDDTEDLEPPPLGPPVTVIATSATLCTTGGSFGYVANELGVEFYDSLVAESPFDFQNQCLFIVPETMPEPKGGDRAAGEAYRVAVAEHMQRIIALAGGRTLGLFTSRKSLESTYDALVGPCAKQGITLLKQGAAGKTKLIEQFKQDTTSVLLGTKGFWAGVDVPGESLSVVIIDRLPFPTPDDPVIDVLSEQVESAFFKFCVPAAIVEFRQAFGRLVRSMECRGAVVCLDRRIQTKPSYGKQFLRALPPVPKTTSLEAIVDWLKPPAPVPEPAWDEP